MASKRSDGSGEVTIYDAGFQQGNVNGADVNIARSLDLDNPSIVEVRFPIPDVERPDIRGLEIRSTFGGPPDISSAAHLHVIKETDELSPGVGYKIHVDCYKDAGELNIDSPNGERLTQRVEVLKAYSEAFFANQTSKIQSDAVEARVEVQADLLQIAALRAVAGSVQTMILLTTPDGTVVKLAVSNAPHTLVITPFP